MTSTMTVSAHTDVDTDTNLPQLLRCRYSQVLPGLRGCRLSSILWHNSLLNDSEGSLNAYDKSFHVSRLDYFLSHSWSASGVWKRLGVVMTFYLSFPIKFLRVLSIMITFMVYFVAFSCFSSLTVVLIGYMILPGALVASILLADKNETVFLDKCCILQTDRNAKLQGISRLSDYLRASDKLVVFWSPDYLKRLWCVYELAKFLETHEMKDVIIINLEHVKFCVWMMLGEGVGIIILEVLRIYLLENKMDTLLPHVLLWYFVSLFVGGRSAYYMDTTLTFRHIARTFKTSNAKCSDAADEPLLHDIIEDAYGSIESFEVVVRNLCLGDDKLGDNPTWLFSKATFQMLCLPFIPYVIGEALLSLFRALGRSTVPAYLIGAPASVVSTPLNVVCSVHAAVVPRVLFSCQAPMLLLVGYKWSIWGYHKNIPQTLVKLSMILFSVLYIWLGQVLQGRRIFDLSIVSFDMVKLLDAPSMLCFGILSVTILLALIQRGYQY